MTDLIGEYCPYGQPGDRLWVRETWAEDGSRYTYRATNETWAWHWAPSIFMPRAASRITLEITDVRVERVQDISEEDARAEGVTRELRGPRTYPDRHAARSHETYRDAYMRLWDALNAKRGCGWAVNPWVWVISFQRAQP